MDLKAKLRPFYVAKMLYEQTDEDHYLTIAQIMEQLEKEYGISTSRGTVGDDIKALQKLGIEIEVIPSTQKRFSLIGRRFDLPAALALCTAGNLLPVPFIILFARRLLGWMRRFAWLQRFSNWLERKAERNSARLARGEFLGLMILVAIPLPGTGAWTGALVASLLGMRLRSSLPAIFLGVVIAGCIMLALSLGVNAVI